MKYINWFVKKNRYVWRAFFHQLLVCAQNRRGHIKCHTTWQAWHDTTQHDTAVALRCICVDWRADEKRWWNVWSDGWGSHGEINARHGAGNWQWCEQQQQSHRHDDKESKATIYSLGLLLSPFVSPLSSLTPHCLTSFSLPQSKVTLSSSCYYWKNKRKDGKRNKPGKLPKVSENWNGPVWHVLWEKLTLRWRSFFALLGECHRMAAFSRFLSSLLLSPFSFLHFLR